jgi:hypothetical protein
MDVEDGRKAVAAPGGAAQKYRSSSRKEGNFIGLKSS